LVVHPGGELLLRDAWASLAQYSGHECQRVLLIQIVDISAHRFEKRQKFDSQ
jgi:hypothetical protein